jgi:hypothetical protein
MTQQRNNAIMKQRNNETTQQSNNRSRGHDVCSVFYLKGKMLEISGLYGGKYAIFKRRESGMSETSDWAAA